MARKRTRSRDPFARNDSIATVTGQAIAELVYDYDQVPEEHREAVKRSALNIKPRLKRAAEDIFVIGEELAATKARLLHGEYTKWLEIEFGLSERMAQRFVNVRDRLGAKSDKLSVLLPSSLYLLAAKSTPDEAIEEIERQIDTGKHIGVAYVQTLITEAKKRTKQAQSTPDLTDVTYSVIVEEETDTTEIVQRLDKALAAAFARLDGQPADDWGELFKNSELSRVRNEIYQLRMLLKEQFMD